MVDCASRPLGGPQPSRRRPVRPRQLQDKLSESAKIAVQNADVSASRYKAYFYVRSQARQFQPGDEVLVLLLSDTSKLLIAWKGPYWMLVKRGKVDYLIDCLSLMIEVYHTNLLKKYFRRSQINFAEILDELSTQDEEEDSTAEAYTCS